MKCPRCGFDSPEGFQFCGKCGKRIPTPSEHTRAVSLSHELNEELAKHLKNMQESQGPEKQKMAKILQTHTGMSPDKAVDTMKKLEGHLERHEFSEAAALKAPFQGIVGYCEHLRRKAESGDMDPDKRKETLRFVGHCVETTIELAGLVATIAG